MCLTVMSILQYGTVYNFPFLMQLRHAIPFCLDLQASMAIQPISSYMGINLCYSIEYLSLYAYTTLQHTCSLLDTHDNVLTDN